MMEQPGNNPQQPINNEVPVGKTTLRPSVAPKPRNYLVDAANDTNGGKSTETKYDNWAQEQLASGNLTAEGVATITQEQEYRKKLQAEQAATLLEDANNQGTTSLTNNPGDLAQYEKWAEERLASGELSAEGVSNINKELAYRRGLSEGAKTLEEQGPSGVDTLQEAAPSTVDPEAVKSALRGFEAAEKSRGGFLRRLGDSMGLTKERIESIKETAGNTLDAYNKLEPKTKIAAGLTITAATMLSVAGGAPMIAVAIGALKIPGKLASTKLMYDGLNGALEKKYEAAGGMSDRRKFWTKVGALTTAVLVNFAASTAITNVLNTDVAHAAFDKIRDFKLPTFAATSTDAMGNQFGGGVDTPVVTEGSWNTGTVGTTGGGGSGFGPGGSNPELHAMAFGSDFGPGDRPEVGPGIDREYWPEKPSAAALGSDFGPGDRPEVGPGIDREYWPEKPSVASVARPEVANGSWNTGVGTNSPVTTAVSTPSGVPAERLVYGFDAASAPPVGSTEIKDLNGKLLGWNLPDGTSMTTEGKVIAPEGSTLVLNPRTGEPTNVLRFPDGRIMDYTSGTITDAPIAVKPPVTFDSFGNDVHVIDKSPIAAGNVDAVGKDIVLDNSSTPAAQTPGPNKFDLRVEESFVKPSQVAVAPVTQPGSVWTTGDGTPLTTADGTPVNSGQAPSVVQAPVAATEKFESFTREPLKQTEYSPVKPNLIMEVPKMEEPKLFTQEVKSVQNLGTITQEIKPVEVISHGPVAHVTADIPDGDLTKPNPVSPTGGLENPAVSDKGSATPPVTGPTTAITQPAVSTPDVTPANNVTQAVVAPTQQPFKLSFVADQSVEMSKEDGDRLASLFALTSSADTEAVLLDAAKGVDKAKSALGFSFSNAEDIKAIKNNFIELIKVNPSMTVGNLLDVDVANLPKNELNVIKESRQFLVELFGDIKSDPVIRDANIVDLLQRKFNK